MEERLYPMTSNMLSCKTKLSEERVIHTTEYMHKDISDGTEVCILKHPLTLEEWNQILKNHEIVTSTVMPNFAISSK